MWFLLPVIAASLLVSCQNRQASSAKLSQESRAPMPESLAQNEEAQSSVIIGEQAIKLFALMTDSHGLDLTASIRHGKSITVGANEVKIDITDRTVATKLKLQDRYAKDPVRELNFDVDVARKFLDLLHEVPSKSLSDILVAATLSSAGGARIELYQIECSSTIGASDLVTLCEVRLAPVRPRRFGVDINGK